MAITHLETAAVIDLTDWNANHVGVPTFVGAKVYNNAVQSVASGSEVALTFDSEEFDTDGFHDTGSNTSRLTIPSGKAGYYIIHAGGFATSTGSPQAFLKINNTTRIRAATEGVNDTDKIVTALVNLAVADYIEIRAFHSTGSSTNWGHASDPGDQWAFSLAWVGT